MSAATRHDVIEVSPASENEPNHYTTVDWDGPNDPNNPKKSASLSVNRPARD